MKGKALHMHERTIDIPRRRQGSRTLHLAFFAVLAAALLLCTPPQANADVRKADIVMGESVESRGLSVAQCPDISADYAFVMDGDGTVYFERDADAEAKIASVTKIMTAVVALDSVPSDTTITVSANAATIGESSAELQEGDAMPLSEALKALMVPSGNDAAQAIAESVGAVMLQNSGGDASDVDACSQAFVDAMNAKAAELGMSNTVYRNPHGLDDGEFSGDQHSSAHDIATLCAYAMQKQAVRDVVGCDTATCAVQRDGEQVELQLSSTDELLGAYDGACGVKTGFTDQAGACFAGACNRNGQDLYAIVLHASDEAQRFVDTTTLWDWVYENTIEYPLANSTQTTVDENSGATVPLIAEVSDGAWTDKTVKATFADPEASVTVFALSGNVSQSVEYRELDKDVKCGDVVGTVTFKQHNETVATMDLVAAESVPAPNVFQGVSIWWNRLLGSFSGAPRSAESVFYNDTPIINDKSSAA